MTGTLSGVDRSSRVVTIVGESDVFLFDCGSWVLQTACEILAAPTREERQVRYDVEDGKIVKIVRRR